MFANKIGLSWRLIPYGIVVQPPLPDIPCSSQHPVQLYQLKKSCSSYSANSLKSISWESSQNATTCIVLDRTAERTKLLRYHNCTCAIRESVLL